jgi:hypothetical protein
LRSAVLKSCKHESQRSLEMQENRLKAAGYPKQFVSQQIRSLASAITRNTKQFENDLPVVAIQYSHSWGHRLKKLARRFDVRIVFKYGNKLAKLPSKVGTQEKCGKSGHASFTKCCSSVVYQLALSCGSSYVGQTGRCLNKRLYEHHKAVKEGKGESSSSLKKHLKKCNGCTVDFHKTQVMNRSGKEKTREIIEAILIDRGGKSVISKPSISLSRREVALFKEGAIT